MTVAIQTKRKRGRPPLIIADIPLVPLNTTKMETYLRGCTAEKLHPYENNLLTVALDRRNPRVFKLLAILAIASKQCNREQSMVIWQAVCRLSPTHTLEQVNAAVKSARAGLQNNKAQEIYDMLHDPLIAQEMFWLRYGNESFAGPRTRISRIKGIKTEKASFILELMYQGDCGVLCIDSNVQEEYGLDKTERKCYTPLQLKIATARIEQHFLTYASSIGVKPVYGRWSFWDSKEFDTDPTKWINDILAGITNATIC